MGLCPFLRFLIYNRMQNYGYDLYVYLMISGLMGHFLRIYEHICSAFPGFMGMLFRKFSEFIGGTSRF